MEHTLSEQTTDTADDPLTADEDEPAGDDRGSDTDAPIVADDSNDEAELTQRPPRRFGWRKSLVWGVIPGLVLLLAVAAGYLKWQDSTLRQSEIAGAQAVQAAQEGTVAMLSYKPDAVDKDLTAARDHLTGGFRDSYTKLIEDVVIPGAKEQRISAVATVPAAATVDVKDGHAVVLVFVNQTTIIGDGAPTGTTSVVKVSLDKVGDRWLISDFQPI